MSLILRSSSCTMILCPVISLCSIRRVSCKYWRLLAICVVHIVTSLSVGDRSIYLKNVSPLWWNNPSRTHMLYRSSRVGTTYRHNDDFLLALIREAQRERESWQAWLRDRNRALMQGRTIVELAWQLLCQYMLEDTRIEQWNSSNWQPRDIRSPHSARDG
jgi:hypothetical protein